MRESFVRWFKKLLGIDSLYDTLYRIEDEVLSFSSTRQEDTEGLTRASISRSVSLSAKLDQVLVKLDSMSKELKRNSQETLNVHAMTKSIQQEVKPSIRMMGG